MKKIAIAVLAAAMMLLSSKNADAQYYFEHGNAFAFGYTSTSFCGQDSNGYAQSVPGFWFGYSLDYAFSTLAGLTIEPGIQFEHYGRSEDYVGGETKYRGNYISVPVNLKYSVEVAPDLVVSALTGPKFNVGFGNMFDKDSWYALKNFDAQWGIGAAVTYAEAAQFRIGYNFGLSRVTKLSGDPKIFRDNFYFGASFMF